MKKIHEMQEKRAALIKEQRSILDAAEADGQSNLSGEATEKFENIDSEIRSLEESISREERTAQRDAELANVRIYVHNNDASSTSGEAKLCTAKKLEWMLFTFKLQYSQLNV